MPVMKLKKEELTKKFLTPTKKAWREIRAKRYAALHPVVEYIDDRPKGERSSSRSTAGRRNYNENILVERVAPRRPARPSASKPPRPKRAREDDEDVENIVAVTVQEALFDLAKVNPNDVASALAEENQLLEDLHEQVADIKDDMLNVLGDLTSEIGEIKQHLGIKNN